MTINHGFSWFAVIKKMTVNHKKLESLDFTAFAV